MMMHCILEKANKVVSIHSDGYGTYFVEKFIDGKSINKQELLGADFAYATAVGNDWLKQEEA